MTGGDTTVIKVGGSILRDAPAYEEVARLLQREVEAGPTCTVVSAARGVTDALASLARVGWGVEARGLLTLHAELGGGRIDPALARELERTLRAGAGVDAHTLFTWGERASVDALRHRLRRRGIDLPAVELLTGASLPRSASVLIPGFYVRDRAGAIRCLPRGGSDISAVLVAAALGSRTVRLWKDGGGFRRDGRVITEVTGAEFVAQQQDPLRPLHTEAVRFASEWGIDLVLEDPRGAYPSTRVRAGRRPGKGTGSMGAGRVSALGPVLAASMSAGVPP